MRRSDFTYDLPEELIAQAPSEPRDAARMLVVHRDSGALEDSVFRELPTYLEPGDLVVANDTRVIPARLRGIKESGGKAEVLLHRREAADRWEALIRSSKRPRPGSRILLGDAGAVEVLDRREDGLYAVRLEPAGSLTPEALVEAVGEMPLPPYIRRPQLDRRDQERYQTLYARPDRGGSAAAPTAGLHFTPAVLSALAERGVGWATLTLHVGLGTFLPVRADDVREHRMHREWYELSAAACEAVNRALDSGRRVVTVGTTATRVLEHCGRAGRPAPGSGWTDLFILPGHEFRVVHAMLTNFHLPESTLLMLVSALAGRERILGAYRHAVESGYRFYSYGDAMLIL